MKGKIIVQEKNKVPFVYQSNDNNSVSDSFKFKANDGEFDSNEGVVNITITQLNDAPTDLAISSTSIAENSAIGTAVGTLSNTDQIRVILLLILLFQDQAIRTMRVLQ